MYDNVKKKKIKIENLIIVALDKNLNKDLLLQQLANSANYIK